MQTFALSIPVYSRIQATESEKRHRVSQIERSLDKNWPSHEKFWSIFEELLARTDFEQFHCSLETFRNCSLEKFRANFFCSITQCILAGPKVLHRFRTFQYHSVPVVKSKSRSPAGGLEQTLQGTRGVRPHVAHQEESEGKGGGWGKRLP